MLKYLCYLLYEPDSKSESESEESESEESDESDFKYDIKNLRRIKRIRYKLNTSRCSNLSCKQLIGLECFYKFDNKYCSDECRKHST